MAGWTNIPDGNLEPGSPIRSADGLALRENPIAIAERAAGAPRVNPTRYQKLTGSGTFSVPNGVTAIKVHLVGAGGAGADNAGTSGGNTTFAASSADGGQAQADGTGGGNGNVSHGGAGSQCGGDSGFGGGGGRYLGNGSGQGFDGGGGGGTSNGQGGGGGGYSIRDYDVTPGQGLNYSCGAGGNATIDANGGDGFIIVEY